MQKIKNRDLAKLLMQLKFTPQQKRRRQLEAAEKLFSVIEEDREYPFSFVFFRITGFQPRDPVGQYLIKGDQLRDDLPIFIAALSGQIAQPVAELSEEVYSIQALAEKLGVSTKTLQRWRRNGLIARKFLFADNLKRLGFLRSRVERFLADNPDLVPRAKGFSRLTQAGKQQIIKRAMALAGKAKTARCKVIAKIAEEFARSHETIRYTLANYEKTHPGKPIFSRPPGVTEPADALEIYRLFNQGVPVGDLMRRFNRSKSSIYRLVNKRRAKSLLRRKIEFIESEEFLKDDARNIILEGPLRGIKPAEETVRPFGQANRSLPDYLRVLKKTPVLNRERERELFRGYNYLKFLACRTRADINIANPLSSLMKKTEEYLAEAEAIQRMLTEANLRLVVNIARKHTAGGANLSDLISEGNYTLMRAIEKFDYTRGFRFGTFASWTIAKDFARKMPSRTARRDKETAASHAKMQEDFRDTDTADIAAIERAHQSLAQVIMDELTRREQYVILSRFGPIGQPIRKKTKTLKQIGDDLGLTKERVRQIELLALQKLRQSLSPKEFELLTG
ncbi:MAG: sigma-70 family RNA polymerase sigma factor [Sedimentisphaerales bacterium]|nr:sigma-70 family RNA polymerase sigma factor [Sedimentisphaerales bacterium]